MSYQRDLGWDVSQLSKGVVGPRLQISPPTAGGGGIPKILLVGAAAGAAFLLWRKFRKKETQSP